MTLVRRVALTVVTGLFATPVAVVALPTSTQAFPNVLCSGYDGCKDAGYSHYGYKTANDEMYWRMYSGHNCTNYVAYRLVKSGLPNERPWSGSGNATNWGAAMDEIVDQTPMVGAVAWWKANSGGVGSNGHVAIVEKVVSATEIVVSEDSWGGDFDWRDIQKSSGSWPSGFIHFNDRPVSMTERPAVTGDPVVGQTLTATTGTWAPGDATYAVQWYADNTAIDGATATSLPVTPDLLDKQLRVRVVASRRGYKPAAARSQVSPAVQPGTLATRAKPTVAGTPQVGETLTLGEASWTPTPESVTTQWLADGQPIDGATGPSLALDPSLVGAAISVQQSATATGYKTSTLTTTATAAVQPGRIEVDEPFSLAGVHRNGRTLTIQPGTFTPTDATLSYAWLRDGTPIDGASQSTYTLTPSDVGHEVGASVTLIREGYRTRTVKLPAALVTTTPVLKVTTLTRPGRTGQDDGTVIARLRVTAEGVKTPTGKVTAWIGSHQVTGLLENGYVRLVLTGIDRGTHRLHLLYAGTGVVEGGHVAVLVKVPKPEKKKGHR